MIDKYNRRINYLRISVTDLCNLRCQYCMPENGIEKRPHHEILSFEEIDKIVSELVEMGIEKVRITGGEPLTKRHIIPLIKRISSHKEIKDLAITTNGILLAEMAKELKDAGVNRFNISIDTLKADKYSKMTRGGNLDKVLESMRVAKEIGMMPIKLNIVLIGGFNDEEIKDFVNLTKDNEIDVRFIELMPIGEVATWSKKRFISNQEILKHVPELEPTEKIDKSSPATYYRLPNGKGKVGLISPISCKFCGDCNRIRLTADGMIRYCLHSDEELNIREALRNKEDIKEKILKYIMKKPQEHKLEEGKYIKRDMVRVGG